MWNFDWLRRLRSGLAFEKRNLEQTSNRNRRLPNRPLAFSYVDVLETRVLLTVLFSDSYNRADVINSVYALGSMDNFNGTAAPHDHTHNYIPIWPLNGVDPSNPNGADIVSNRLQNRTLDFGGVQITTGAPNGSTGENVGQDLNISADLTVPRDASGNATQAGLYFRSRAAFRGDGINGGTSAGYWVQLISTGEVIVKPLNTVPGGFSAVTARPTSFDPSADHTLVASFTGTSLQVAVDGQLQTFLSSHQGNSQVTTVSIPPTTNGTNNGTSGVSFGAESNRFFAGSQTADNLVYSTYTSLTGLPVSNNFTSSLDYGDAPDTGLGRGANNYNTRGTDNGPSHVVVSGLRIGTTLDAENDATPNSTATGDDTTNSDDEDGISGPISLSQGDTPSIQVFVANSTGTAATLAGWIDYNGDGIFDNNTERATAFVGDGTGGLVTLVFPEVPFGAVASTFARFRLSTDPNGQNPVGAAADGEVEDYAVTIGTAPDFGDAPNSYGTLTANSGARHTRTALRLGNQNDGEADGLPSTGADGDDLNNTDDEDGVIFLQSALIPGRSASVQVTASQAGKLDAWIDFNGNGIFGHPSERITATGGTALTGGFTTDTINFTVPANAVPTNQTYARFRVSTNGGLSPVGLASDGEVEDYTVVIDDPLDFGDAPNTYGTTSASNGARHTRLDGFTLGGGLDGEPDGQPTTDALGDDNDFITAGNVDDEDGVIFLTQLFPGSMAQVQVVASQAGKLDGWIDFDGNGVFDPTNERITAGGGAALTGSFTADILTFTVPVSAVATTQTFARFRYSSAGGLNPTGLAADGEVEDHTVSIEDRYDYGDAPDTYGTLSTSSGARHSGSPGLRLGNFVDGEPNGQPSPDATGDDNDFFTPGNFDDEDGVVFTQPSLLPGRMASVQVTASAVGKLDAWIDFDSNGVFDASTERITAGGGTALTGGGETDTLSFTVPAGAVITSQTFARFRLSSAGGLNPTGDATDGEVEDYTIAIEHPYDFGDAPDPAYATLLASNGPRHAKLHGFFLGSGVDTEANGQPSTDATGDDFDFSSGFDDEDGVQFLTPLFPGQTGQIQVTASLAGKLDAWIDFNGNGSFLDAGEQITVAGGTSLTGSFTPDTLSFSVPAGATPTSQTIGRFRFSSAGGLGPTGEANDGEVEDHALSIEDPLDFGDAPDTYGTLLTGGGARHTAVPSLRLGALIDGEADGQPNATATGDDTDAGPGGGGGGGGIVVVPIGGSVDDEDGVTFLETTLLPGKSASVQVTASAAGKLDAWIDFNGNGVFDETERVTAAGGTSLTGGGTPETLVFSIPGSATPQDQTYARFRLSTVGGLGPTGLANDGEVEDYTVSIEDPLDYGDAPDTYGTLIASSGASHTKQHGFYLGSGVDGEPNGQPTADATGDDSDFGSTNNFDDEDGVTVSQMFPGQSASLSVFASDAGKLDGWIDFNGNGSFEESERVTAAGGTSLTGNFQTDTVIFTVPAGAVPTTQTFARFRLSSTGGLGPTGAGGDGEVEDYTVSIDDPQDFGDAPDTYGTLLASNGARHTASLGLHLGSQIDGEPNGQPDATATGDDNDFPNSFDDEDGVVFGSVGSFGQAVLIPGRTGSVQVTTNAAGKLDAWIDFNSNGVFDEAERITAAGGTVLTNEFYPNTFELTFNVPADAVPNAQTFSRFRLSTAGGLGPTGAAGDGEVEDHVVEIEDRLDYGDAPAPYPTLLADNGARHHKLQNFYLGNGVDGDPNGRPSSAADGDDNDFSDPGSNFDDEDGVTFNGRLRVGQNASLNVEASANGVLNAWLDFNADGDWSDAGEQVFTNQALTAGSNPLQFAIPEAAVAGATYARFRFSSASGLSFTGEAADGEVEDYRVGLSALFTEDLTTPLEPIDLANQLVGAGITVSNVTYVGAEIAAGRFQRGPTSIGFESGVILSTGNIALVEGPNQSDSIGLSNGTPGDANLTTLSGVPTFDAAVLEFDFVPTADTVTFRYVFGSDEYNEFVNSGFNDTFAFIVNGVNYATVGSGQPVSINTINMGSNSNLFRNNDLSDGGGTLDTEMDGLTVVLTLAAPVNPNVTNHMKLAIADGSDSIYDSNVFIETGSFQTAQLDFGDAPNTFGTTLANSGARHAIVTGLFLGSAIDGEADGQPNAAATGDDLAGTDDEDGVVFTTQLLPGQIANAQVTASAAGLLDAWVDFNADGVFQAGEKLQGGTIALAAGMNNVSFTVPLDSVAGSTYARFRFSRVGSLGPTGFASDGEVEDYAVTITENRGTITINKDAVPNNAQDFSFTGDLGAFLLDDDSDGTLPSSRNFLRVNGTYVVTEAAVAGWDLTNLTINDPDGGSSVNLATRTVTIDLDTGENISIVFTNSQRGSITVFKDADPNHPQNFSFTDNIPGSPGTFSLDDDSDGTLPNSHAFNNLVPGTYTITELAVAGWSLSNLVINDPDGGSSVNLETRTATIDVDPGEHIDVTFTNTTGGSITIVKDASPNSPQDFAFSGDLGTFSLDDDSDGTLSHSHVSNNVAPGTYVVTEAAVVGWDLTSLVVNDPDGGSSVNLGTRTVTIDVDPGENITVTFTNTASGSITVVKDAVPNDGQDFTFSRSFGANFSLDDDTDGTLSNSASFSLAPGSYSITELAQAGWDLSNVVITGDDGDSTVTSATADLVLDPGENITVTFTNTRRGSITVVKDAVPNDGQDFTFSRSFGANFSLDDDTDNTLSNSASFDLAPGSYSITELAQAGWDLTNVVITGDDGDSTVTSATADLVLDPGENITVTFTNTRRGSITVVKDAVPNDGQDFTFSRSFGANFSLDDDTDGTLSNSASFNLAPGSYSITELAQAGWDLTNVVITGDDGDSTVTSATADLVLDPGENITVTFTNTRRGSITVVKDAVPNDGQDFTFSRSFGANFSLDDDTDGTLSNSASFNLAPGSYSITELAQAGWDLTNVVITGDDGDSTVTSATADLVLDPGENITVTFTNTRRGSITVVKDAAPNDAQDFTFSRNFGANFSLDDDSDGTLSNSASFNLSAGSYSITELAQAGWDLTNVVITGDDGDSTVTGATANLVLDPGENITITFTNTKRGSITVVKDAVPNSSQDFTFSRSFGANFSLDDDADGTLSNTASFNLAPGSYSITELAQAGWDLTNVVITGDDGDSTVTSATADLVLDPGENITVTFSNTRRGSITVVKDSVPNDGQDFTFSRSFGANFSLDDDTDGTLSNSASFDLAPGSYSITELAQAGWDLTNVVITGDDGDSTVTSATADLVLDPGENITVTFTNTRRGSITVVKDAVPNDGQDFTFSRSFGANFSLDDDTDGTLSNSTSFNLAPGSYSITELAQAGWDLTNVVITGDDGDSTVTSATANLVLDPGENITVTFTNTRRGSITVVKDAVPNDGQDFTFSRSFGANFLLDDDTDAALSNTRSFDLAPGSYSITELAQAGWDLTNVVITGDDGDSTVTSATANLVLDPGENIMVTFVNTRRGSITVVKDAVPNDGQDFTFSRSFGANFSLDDDANATLSNSASFSLAPGSYSITELAQAGWDLTSVVITGDDGDSTVTSATADLVLDPGENITVTFTNTRRGSITVVKDAVPNDGQDFSFSRSFGANFSLDDDADGTLSNSTSFDLAPGSYSITELAQAGWDLTNVVITGDDGDSTVTSATANLVLDPGENITVTFTNSQRGGITIVKDAQPNHAQDFAFSGDLGSFSLDDDSDGTLSNSAGFTGLQSGTYIVTEAAVAGWDLSSVVINDPDGGSSVNLTTRTVTIDLDPGENITVTFTNTQRGGITVIKDADPNSAQDFVFGGSFGNFTLDDDSDGTLSNQQVFSSVQPGTYTINEAAVSGWDLASLVVNDPDGGSTVNLATRTVTIDLDPGENITVTFTNERRGSITVVKDAVPGSAQDFVFSGDLGSFTLDDDNAAPLPDSQLFSNLLPGTYVVTEAAVSGWDLSSLVINDPDGGSSVNLATRTATIDVDPGEAITVTFTNTQRGSITVVKDANPNSAQDFAFSGGLGNFSLDDDSDGTLPSSQLFSNLQSGQFIVTEAAVSGWDLTNLVVNDPDGGSSVNLATRTVTIDLDPGENITVTFTNTQRGSITVSKDAIPDSPQDFAYSGGLGAFSLDDDSDGTLPSSQLFSNLTPGTYVVTEAAVAGWDLTNLVVNDPDGGSSVNLATRTVTIDLDPGETISVAFSNTQRASVTVVKDANPNNAQNFAFSGDLGSFTLDDDSDGTLPSSQVFSNLAAGTYVVTEAAVAGWDLTNLVINDPDGGSSINLATRTATIDVDPGEIITVTFTNTQRGGITIVKDANPNDAQDFAFTGDLGSFSLDDDSNATLSNMAAFSNLQPGTYIVTEAAVSGWDLTNLVVNDPDGGSSVNLATRTVTIDLDPGEAISATFTNTQRGSITIVKDANPNDAQDFAFSGDLGNFSLDDDSDGTLPSSQLFANLTPGTYVVTEAAVSGWDLATLQISDPDGGSSVNLATRTVTIDLDPGENLTATFTNARRGGITIIKDAIPNDAQDFAFTGDLGSFTLDDDSDGTLSNMQAFPSVVPGTYLITESAVAGWELASIVINDPDGGSSINLTTRTATIDLDPGETISVTFSNGVVDFGDAPDNPSFTNDFPTLLASNGARHLTGSNGPRLGAQVDTEFNGQPTAAADGDDLAVVDDEDGIAFLTTLVASSSTSTIASIELDLQNASGVANRLDAWIDLNRDSDWNDPGEQIFTSFDLGTANGKFVLPFTIPQDTGSNVNSGDTYARFRLSTAGGLSPSGLASDGEVEDYRVAIVQSASNTNAVVTAPTGGGTLTVLLSGLNTIVRQGATTIFSAPRTELTTLTVHGTAAGNDTLVVDFTGGSPAPSGGLTFNGGLAGTDRLTLTNGSATTVTHTFSNGNDGNVQVDASVIHYTGLEPVTDSLTAVNRVFTFNGGTETITLVAGGTNGNVIDSNLGESVDFTNPTGSLTINTGTGDDTFSVSGVGSSFSANVTINGGLGTDAVNVTGAVNIGTGNATVGGGSDVESISFNGGSLSTTGNVSLTSSGGVTDNDAGVDITANQLTLSAGAAGVGAPSAPLHTTVSNLEVLSGGGVWLDNTNAVGRDVTIGGIGALVGVSAAGTVRITNANDLITVSELVTTTGSLLVLMAEGIRSNSDGASTSSDITATNIRLLSANGIGTMADELEVDATTLAFSNSASGDVFIRDVAGGVTIGDVDGQTSSGNTAAGGVVSVTALSPLTVAHNVSSVGAIVLSSTDSAATGADHLQVNTNVTVQSSGSNVTLNAGDNLTLAENSSVIAAGTLSLNGDVGNADAGSGSNITLNGNLSGTGAASVNGGPDNDTILVFPRQGGGGDDDTVTALQLDGAGGSDTYDIHGGGLTGGVVDVTVADSGASGADVAVIHSSNAAESISVHNNAPNGSAQTGGFVNNTTSGERVNYTTTLERLEVRGDESLDANDGADTFSVQPSQTTRILIHGNHPQFGGGAGDVPQVPGDVLAFDPFGQTYQINGQSLVTQGGSPGAFLPVAFRSIERLDVAATPPQLTIGSPEPPVLEANGVTVDAFTGYGAPPNTLITVAAGLDTNGDDVNDAALVVTSTDQDTNTAGLQVMSNANGQFIYSVRRPTASGRGYVTFAAVGGTETGVAGIDFAAVGQDTTDFRYDLGTTTSLVQTGYDQADQADLYSPAAGYGWVATGGLTSIDAGPRTGSTYSNLLRDVNRATTARTFRADVTPGTYDVTVTLGEASTAGNINVTVAAGSIVSGAANVTGIITTAGQHTHRTVRVASADAGGGLHRIELTFSAVTAGAAWFVNGITFRPADIVDVNALNVTAPSGGNLDADGTSIDAFTVVGADVGSLYTVATTLGTISGVTDADPFFAGIQIAGTGSPMTINVQRPVTAGTATLSVREVSGTENGSATQSYVLPSTRLIDLGTTTSLVQAGYQQADHLDLYNATVGYGWVGSGPNSVDRGARTGSTFSNLLRDSTLSTSVKTFRMDASPGTYDVTVTLGDTTTINDIDVTVATGTVVSGLANVTNIALVAGTYTHRTVRVSTADAGGGQHAIALSFAGTGNPWVVNGITLRPIAIVDANALTVTPPQPPGDLVANGTSIDTFMVTGTDVGKLYTVAITQGTVVSIDGDATPDQDPHYVGVQVAGTGAAMSIDVRRPTTAATATLSVREVSGAENGSVAQEYILADLRRFDFNNQATTTATPSPTAAGFTPITPFTLFTTTQGYGWIAKPNGYDRGSATGVATVDLYRDGVVVGTSTFRLAVTTGTIYDLQVYSGDSLNNGNRLLVSVEGGAFTNQTAPLALNQYVALPLQDVQDMNGDGYLDIFLTKGTSPPGSGVGYALGFDIAVNGGLPMPAAPLAAVSIGSGGDSIDSGSVQSLVGAAIQRWSDAGLSRSAIDHLRTIEFRVQDLSGALLGVADNNVILIDSNAAGHGWFIDDTPLDDAEFASDLTAANGPAAGRIDLLSVLMHELGHTLGMDHDHSGDDLMSALLGTGQRRLADVDDVFAANDVWVDMD